MSRKNPVAVDTTGLVKLGVKIGDIGLVNPEAIAEKIRKLVVKDIQANFDEESAAGVPWPELAKTTAQKRKREGFPARHPILKVTGRLEKSVTKQLTVKINRLSITFRPGGDDEVKRIAGYHVRGTKKIPKRSFFELSRSFNAAANKVIDAEQKKIIRKAIKLTGNTD